jgi:hypothetical protein
MFGRSLYSPKISRSNKRLNTNLDPLQDLQQSIARLTELLIVIQRENDIGVTGKDHRQVERNGEIFNVTENSPSIARRKKPSYANMLRSDEKVHSYYLTVSVAQEEEMIELIRNIMDLVVKAEQRAAKMNDSNSNNGSDKDPATTTRTTTDNQQLSEESQHSAIFEYFCETNTLSDITNIATGLAFITFSKTETNTTNNGGGKAPTTIHLYPPISVAIQIIQSISILLTNLSKATSLYFILSNNKINDLINFPFDNYKMAEYNKTQDKKNSTNKKVDISSIGELSEMEAAYIMFLKSLCMRMNSETLQFYLQLEGM